MKKRLASQTIAVMIGLGLSSSALSTEIIAPCVKGDEAIRFTEDFPANWRSYVENAVTSAKGADTFERAVGLITSETPLVVQEISEYLKARSYYTEGLQHLAHERFAEMVARPMTPTTPVEARVAAMECMLKIQQTLPSLSVKSKNFTSNLKMLLDRQDLTPAQRDTVAFSVVNRMKELVNRWNKPEIETALEALKNEKGYLTYAQALLVQRHGNFIKATELWTELLDKGALPKRFEGDRETLVMILARDLYEMKNYQASADTLRKIPRDSNYLPQALSDLTWALLMAGKKREAVGTAFNIQKSLLNKTFTPEAPLVASIAYFEMCQYARALKNSVYFKKKYLPILNWYKRLSLEQSDEPYKVMVQALRKKETVPSVVLLEWLRNPEFRAVQQEANSLFTEKRLAFQLHSERLSVGKNAAWAKEWKAPIASFYKTIKGRQTDVATRLNKVLKTVNKRLAANVGRLIENTQLLEIEIFDAAGEDMVWRNVNGEYMKWAARQPDEKRAPNLYWEWGEIPVDPASKDEVWEDELGWTLGNVDDECRLKNRYKQLKARQSARSQNRMPASKNGNE